MKIPIHLASMWSTETMVLYVPGRQERKGKKAWGIREACILPGGKSIVSRRNARSSEPIWNAIVKGGCTLHIGVSSLHIIRSDSTLPKLFQPVRGRHGKLEKRLADEDRGPRLKKRRGRWAGLHVPGATM